MYNINDFKYKKGYKKYYLKEKLNNKKLKKEA